MLIKRIVCSVPEDAREAFDKGQRAWRPIRYVDGLVAQVGGYVIGEEGRACILAVWRDEESYTRFMRDVHDAMASATNQADTYDALEVSLYDVVSRMPGQRIRLGESLGAGRLLRIAACRVKPEAVEHFVRVQLQVWTPGMASAKGMFGGAFARSREDDDAFLVATAWENEELHQLYADHHLPELRKRAGAEEDLASIEGCRVALERHWTVLGVG